MQIEIGLDFLSLCTIVNNKSGERKNVYMNNRHNFKLDTNTSDVNNILVSRYMYQTSTLRIKNTQVNCPLSIFSIDDKFYSGLFKERTHRNIARNNQFKILQSIGLDNEFIPYIDNRGYKYSVYDSIDDFDGKYSVVYDSKDSQIQYIQNAMKDVIYNDGVFYIERKNYYHRINQTRALIIPDFFQCDSSFSPSLECRKFSGANNINYFGNGICINADGSEHMIRMLDEIGQIRFKNHRLYSDTTGWDAFNPTFDFKVKPINESKIAAVNGCCAVGDFIVGILSERQPSCRPVQQSKMALDLFDLADKISLNMVSPDEASVAIKEVSDYARMDYDRYGGNMNLLDVLVKQHDFVIREGLRLSEDVDPKIEESLEHTEVYQDYKNMSHSLKF